MRARPGSSTPARVRVVGPDGVRERSDRLATEEPLEVRIVRGGVTTPLAVTMRTPGADFELAAGFLHGEGIVRDRDRIRRIAYCMDPGVPREERYNTVHVELSGPPGEEERRLERHFMMTSACGVCGKAALEALELRGCEPIPAGFEVEADLLPTLPAAMREGQGVFEATGGLHAAALFTASGELRCLREDIGRHNAVDKVVGWALLEGGVDLAEHLLLVSGRAGFEILQKAVAARIPVVASVSAPSSLAVALARRFDVTLVGFLRGNHFNLYHGTERVRGAGAGAGRPP